VGSYYCRGMTNTKRPPSLSDSNIYVGDYKFDSINTFHSRKVPLINDDDIESAKVDLVLGEPLVSTDKTVTVVVVSWFEFCVDYSLRFVGHVFLISIFEALFFFAFVSKDEDRGILATTSYYTNSVINSCSGLDVNESNFLNLILERFVNSTQVLADGQNFALGRQVANFRLYSLAWSYVGILGGIEIILLIVSYLNKFKVKWGHIIFENLALVTFLGFYEYMFFETVIKKYSTETPQEISAEFVKGLQQRCGLLT